MTAYRPVSTTPLHKRGTLVISLDFELYWGVRDVLSLGNYRANLLGVRRVVPLLLELFQHYDIHATWATVGFLFFDDKEELLSALPRQLPKYADVRLTPYPTLPRVGTNEAQDPFHFGWSLLEQILPRRGQEIASHTFSHYYCLEPGQDAETFQEDLAAAVEAAARRGVTLESLVFPRNQVEPTYLPLCAQQGIRAYRGTRPLWFDSPRSAPQETKRQRAVRLVDSYLPLTRYRSDLAEVATVPCNVPASRFLRPYAPGMHQFDRLKVRRICTELSRAAVAGDLYHLWWHPHNFGTYTRENLDTLRRILSHFVKLRETYGMQSLTMCEAAEEKLGAANAEVPAGP